MTEVEFRKWYQEPVAELQKLEGAGFPQMLIALPLIERYLRQKSGIGEATSLSDPFFKELKVVFPELDSENIDAKSFWQVFRNGLLHQVTMSQKPIRSTPAPPGALTYNDKMIKCDPGTGMILVNPTDFADRVLDTIKNDFGTFEGSHSPNHPLPIVHQSPLPDTTSNVRISGGSVP